MKKLLYLILFVSAAVLLLIYVPRTITNMSTNDSSDDDASSIVSDVKKLPNFDTDTSKASIDLGSLLSGGPGKDGIPAIDDPKFVGVDEALMSDDVLGMLVEFDGEKRYYPYNILVWHEIVNDSIGSNEYAVTFCPLCGSAIVYDRNVDGKLLEFGVSGFLHESNMVMYDKTTETLWSQSRGEGIVGEMTGTKLTNLPVQLVTFSDIKANHSDAKILSQDTGYTRNYDFYPYGDYDESEEVYFAVSVQDKRLPTKEIMYVVPFGEKSVAVTQNKLKDGAEFENNFEGKDVLIRKDGENIFFESDGKILPGYFEMWFSWATQHENDGIVWEL